MQRIVIVGPSGSGKSTLGKTLSNKLGIPVIHLDSLFFKAGWVEIEKEELVEKVTQFIAVNEKWIIEGNYSSTLPIRLEHCDQAIFLDYPRFLYFLELLNVLLSIMVIPVPIWLKDVLNVSIFLSLNMSGIFLKGVKS